MHSPRWFATLAALALTLALAFSIDWAAAEWLSLGSNQARFWLLALTFGLITAGSTSLWLGERARYRNALEELELMGRSESNRAAGVLRADAWVGARWHRALQRVEHRLGSLSRRVDELDREREAYEHRAKRFESQSRQVRSVLSALAEPVLVIDKRDQLVLSNSSANRVLAIPPDSDGGRALDTLLRCEELVALLTDTRRRSVFTERHCEIEVPDEHGQPRWFRVNARNIPTQPGDSDPDGTSQGAVALLHDISAQRVLQKRNAELVSAVSHEMRTPLAGILAYTELLADGDAEDAQAQMEFLRIIEQQAGRLQQLVDDMVELARIEADLSGQRRTVQPLIPALTATMEKSRATAAARQVHLTSVWGPDDVYVLIDVALFQQAMLHLLSNAIDHTPEQGEVSLTMDFLPNEATIGVRDSGSGIPPQDCERIFEKFYRTSESMPQQSGSGLGMAIVRHIIEDVHGGHISVSSTEGRGTEFQIHLATVPVSSETAATKPDKEFKS